jgi:NAD(P)-dependent dehydrogenase (short-subunit alcohol dehydrogenase family)
MKHSYTMTASMKNGRVALVTGAGSGIGRAAALALLGDGYCVTLVGRRPEPLDETARAAPDRALVVPADVTDPQAVREAFSRTRDAFGRLDVLFNNAGRGTPRALFEDVTLDDWRAVVEVNLTAMFVCMQEAFKLMKEQTPRGGRIINNGSLSAQSPRPNSAPYTATKHAVTGLTKSGSLDGRKYDIACSQIDIGNAATPMTERMVDGVLQAHGALAVEPRMDVAHVGQAVLAIANLPLDANVPFMTIMATKMPMVGRG